MDVFEEFKSRIKDAAEVKPGQFEGCCPNLGHGDKGDNTPSFSFRRGRKRAVVGFCHAGCTWADIVQSVGMTLAELSGHSPKANGGRANGHARSNGKASKHDRTKQVEYHYLDADGKRHYTSTRWWDHKKNDKTFTAGHVDPATRKWISNIDGMERIPYRLNDLVRKQPKRAFICEGEKDCETLRRLGLLGTTNICGAMGWTTEGKYLEGFDLFVLEDNDDTGRQRSKLLKWELHKIVASLRFIALPGLAEHGDVSDWAQSQGIVPDQLAAPGQCEAVAKQLVEIALATPAWTATESELASIEADLKALGKGKADPDVADANAKPLPEIVEADCVLCADVRKTGTGLVSSGPTDATSLAFGYLKNRNRHLYNNSTYYTYSGGRYSERSEEDTRAFLRKSIERQISDENDRRKEAVTPEGKPPKLISVTKEMVLNALDSLKSLVIVPGEYRSPVWLAETEHSRNCLPMKNGILNLDRIIEGHPEPLLPHTDTFFSTVLVPYNFDPTATCPLWHKFLNRNLEGDAERIAYLQEFFGYCLLPDARFHEFLLLFGEGKNGKSVICSVLSAMLGDDNVSRVPLETFGQRFALIPTLGKLANVCAEVGELDKVAEGHLKAFVSGDPMQFEPKYKPAFNARPTAKLILATNSPPRFTDRSDGIWRRISPMPMRVVIGEHEVIRGMDSLKFWADTGELPGVLTWAIEGLRRLLTSRGFTRSKVCVKAKEEYRKEINPARAYLREHYGVDQDGAIACLMAYRDYVDECERTGHKPLGEGQFGKEVFRLFPHVERKRKRHETDQRVYFYVGMRKKTEEEKRLEDEKAEGNSEHQQGTFEAMR